MALFRETLVADIHNHHENISRTFKKDTLLSTQSKGLLNVDKGVSRLDMVTTDDRLAELVEMVYEVTKDPKAPLLVTSLHKAN